MSLNGLTTVNVELSSKCNKNCWMCGRRKTDKEYPEIALNYGFMDFDLVKKIASEVPEGIVIQLHNNGEPLLYPQFGEALDLFKNNITNIVTNGKLLVAKADEIIGKLDTLSVSIFENDDEQEEQLTILRQFLWLKKYEKPYVTLRLIGDVKNVGRYKKLDQQIITRTLHDPMGSFKYRREPTIPEIGICLDFLNHLAIDKNGDVSICVRFDPGRLGVLGNIKDNTLEEIWNGELRMKWKEYHIAGDRSKIPLCSYCKFWGVPTGN